MQREARDRQPDAVELRQPNAELTAVATVDERQRIELRVRVDAVIRACGVGEDQEREQSGAHFGHPTSRKADRFDRRPDSRSGGIGTRCVRYFLQVAS